MTTSRNQVGRQQRELLDVLFRGRPASGGPDPMWLDVAHDALVRKRAWACSVTWPGTVRSLGGDEYVALFSRYVREAPYPPPGGSQVDGRLFVTALAKWRSVPDLGKLQAMAFDLRYRLVAGEKVGRRGLKICVCRLRNPAYLVAGIRVPILGKVFVGRIPMGLRRMT